MMPKVLAWTALGTAAVFVIAALVAVFAAKALGPTASAIAFWIGVGMLSLSILLALALLVITTFPSDS
ncbi:MAG: hypothetical protein ACKO4Z_09955 [Planctomycetota bacterium]